MDIQAQFIKMGAILKKFGIAEPIKRVEVLKNGHINNTLLVDTAKARYIVQEVNSYVFKDPVKIMENIEMVTDHIRAKKAALGVDTNRGILNFLHAADGLNYTIDENGSLWRVCPYIDRTATFEQVESLDVLYNAGYGFGEFQAMLSDFPIEKLNETIEDFHNTRKRLINFFDCVDQNPSGRAAEVRREIDFFEQRRESAGAFTKLIKDKTLPLRVTHNDTKYNNILIDTDTNKAVCVIDLDTVMPGLSVYDFGDAIRFAASTAKEDEVNLDLVKVNMEYFKTFANGFFGALNHSLSRVEMENMVNGCINITIELASRFLGDHIMGDKYFRIHHPNHNLERARNQIQLAMDMEKNRDEMTELVMKYL